MGLSVSAVSTETGEERKLFWKVLIIQRLKVQCFMFLQLLLLLPALFLFPSDLSLDFLLRLIFKFYHHHPPLPPPGGEFITNF